MPESRPRRDAGTLRVRAPGRVNLMGDHTDYTGGLVLPMAIDRYLDIVGRPGGDHLELRSDAFGTTVQVALDVDEVDGVPVIEPEWGRYVAGVVAAVRPDVGFAGTVSSTLPTGVGLASSAALEVATALVLGASGADPVELARVCQRADHLARGGPGGITDQLAVVAGRADHALLIDCSTLDVTGVPLPEEVEIVIVRSGQARQLAASAHAERVAECAAVEAEIGPLRAGTPADVDRIGDRVLRRRARHVVSENQRVRDMVIALQAGDLATCGRLMLESHASLRDDYEVTTPALDNVVGRLARTPGVLGARMTGAGFGGCVVAFTRPGTELAPGLDPWIVRAVDGAHIVGGSRAPSR